MVILTEAGYVNFNVLEKLYQENHLQKRQGHVRLFPVRMRECKLLFSLSDAEKR